MASEANDSWVSATSPQLQTEADMIKAIREAGRTPAPLYRVPGDQNFPYYLLRIEQLLAVRCSAMDGVRANFLNGEREIIEGNLQLCLAWPDNVGARLLLFQTVLTMKKIRPDILPEIKDKLT